MDADRTAHVISTHSIIQPLAATLVTEIRLVRVNKLVWKAAWEHVVKLALQFRAYGLIHHSDRGIQYCSTAYIKELEKHHILISMTENGDPLENAIAERVNGILKNELYLKTNKK